MMHTFLEKIKNETGQLSFTYYIAVTKLTGKNIEENRKLLENSETIKARFKNHGASVEIKLLPLHEIISKIQNRMNKKETPALESTNIGRLLQLLNAMDKDFFK